MGWFDVYLQMWQERIREYELLDAGAYAKKPMTIGNKGARFFNPEKDGEKAEAFFNQHQGLTEIVLLQPEDLTALSNGQVLCISVAGEYAIAIAARDL